MAGMKRKGAKKGRKKTSAEHIDDLASMIRENENAKKRKPIEVVYKRDPVTEERVFHPKYRPGRRTKYPSGSNKRQGNSCTEEPEVVLDDISGTYHRHFLIFLIKIYIHF